MITWLGIIEFTVLTLTFWVIGRRFRVFCGVFVWLVLGFFVVTAQSGDSLVSADAILTLGGIVFYFFGLLIVRLVIDRSVSVHLLLNPDAATRIERMKEEINDRVSDISRYRLGSESGDALHLTAFGRLMAGVTAILYSILGQKT